MVNIVNSWQEFQNWLTQYLWSMQFQETQLWLKLEIQTFSTNCTRVRSKKYRPWYVYVQKECVGTENNKFCPMLGGFCILFFVSKHWGKCGLHVRVLDFNAGETNIGKPNVCLNLSLDGDVWENHIIIMSSWCTRSWPEIPMSLHCMKRL